MQPLRITASTIGTNKMNTSNEQTGYNFSDRESSEIQNLLKRILGSTGIGISYGIGESRGFAAVMIGIDDDSLRFKGDVVRVQSWRAPDGVVRFGAVAAADGQSVGDATLFNTLLEALVVADVFLRRFIDALIAKRSSERLANSRSNPVFAGNAIESRVLSPEEVHYVQTFANDLGRTSGLTGFAKFIESSAGVMSIALGVMNKEEPIMLGTVVAVSNETGSSCTVRDFQNRPMSGPEYYETIYAALVTTRSSFEKLAQITAKHLRPSLLSRLFGR